MHYFVVDPEGLRREEGGGDRFKVWWQILQVDALLCACTHVRGKERGREEERQRWAEGEGGGWREGEQRGRERGVGGLGGGLESVL